MRWLIVFLFVLCGSVGSVNKENSEPWIVQINNKDGWHDVYATREGLIGKRTATGHKIKKKDIFVALPSRKALHKTVVVSYKNIKVICEVLDVGPHSISDQYWLKNKRPLAEKGKRIPHRWGRAKNKAGIDLSDGLWDEFEIKKGKGIVKVKWKFLK